MGNSNPENAPVEDRSNEIRQGRTYWNIRGCRCVVISGRLLAAAVILTLLFGAAHMLGFREYTSVLAGYADYGAPRESYGLAYVVLYGCSAVLAPVLAIAASILFVFGLVRRDNW